jgi:hypothetical protein
MHFVLAVSHFLKISDIVHGPFVFASLSLDRISLNLHLGAEFSLLLESWLVQCWDWGGVTL